MNDKCKPSLDDLIKDAQSRYSEQDISSVNNSDSNFEYDLGTPAYTKNKSELEKQ